MASDARASVGSGSIFGSIASAAPLAADSASSGGRSRRSTPRTAGRSSTARHGTLEMVANRSSALVVPMASASGPAIAAPNGKNSSETIQSYELTRDRLRAGTWVWTVVCQIVSPSELAADATSTNPSTTSSGGVDDRPSSRSALKAMSANTTISGRAGRQRRPAPPPSRPPSPNIATTRPQSAAPA
jgi:hypothetical protein